MDNILSYIKWRGDLTVRQSRFNEVDNLILSTLSYLSFDGIIPESPAGSISIGQAAQRYFRLHPLPDEQDIEKMNTGSGREWMFYLMASSRRFRNMRLSNYKNILDPESVKQFTAMTIHTFRNDLYIAYRGTNDTLTGWKEDFLLACLPEVASQEEAVNYARTVAEQYTQKRLFLGGHSKGGNLAVYAAVKVPMNIQDRIQTVWSNDGPGYQEDFITSESYLRMAAKIHTIVPKSSVVGMLMAHDHQYTIVDSYQKGLLQHDGLSWRVIGNQFVHFPELTRESQAAGRSIRTWLDTHPQEERLAFVNALFDVLSATGTQKLSEIRRDRIKSMIVSLPYYRELPKDTREQILRFFVLLNSVTLRLNNETAIEKTSRMIGKISFSTRSAGRKAREERKR